MAGRAGAGQHGQMFAFISLCVAVIVLGIVVALQHPESKPGMALAVFSVALVLLALAVQYWPK